MQRGPPAVRHFLFQIIGRQWRARFVPPRSLLFGFVGNNMTTNTTIDAAAIENALRLIIPAGQVTELRALEAGSPPRTCSGYYNDSAKLAKDAASIKRAKGIYFIPNPVKPALLARATNSARAVGKGDPTTSDNDIECRRWLLIDADAVRPAGIAASDEEHAAALARVAQIAAWLTEQGWPAPIEADSGNGGHLLYRIDLPTDDGGLVQRCLEALASRFDDATVKIDKSVFNPARIWKLYGTLACKGDAAAAAIGRPHRLSKIITAPGVLGVVSREQLAALAPPAQPVVVQPRVPGSFDIAAWIAEHGLDATGPESWKGSGRRWVFKTCPWNPDHTNGSAFIAEQPSGAIAAGCHHNGCQGNDWHSLRMLVDRDYAERQQAFSIVPADHIEDDEPIADEPQAVPECLLRVPGFVSEVMDYCLETAPYPNVALAFGGALCLQALLAGSKVRDPSDNRSNLYLLGLANSGCGKDAPRKVNTRILAETGLLDCLGDKFSSGEGIQDALYMHPVVLFQNDEIDGLLQSINKSKDARHEGIMTTLLSLYGYASSVYPMRKKAGQAESQVIDQPCLVMFGTAIPQHFYEALSGRMLSNGFLGRWLIVESGKRQTGQDAKIIDIPSRVMDTACRWRDSRPGELRGNLAKWHPTPKIVPYSEAAKCDADEMRAYYDSEHRLAEERGDHTAMSVWARANEHARKLALIYAVSECDRSPLIGCEPIAWAREFVTLQSKWLLFKASMHVADNPFHELCQKFTRRLLLAPNRTMNRGKLLKAMHCEALTLDKVAMTLSQQGDVAVVEVPTNGRSAIAYKLLRA